MSNKLSFSENCRLMQFSIKLTYINQASDKNACKQTKEILQAGFIQIYDLFTSLPSLRLIKDIT